MNNLFNRCEVDIDTIVHQLDLLQSCSRDGLDPLMYFFTSVIQWALIHVDHDYIKKVSSIVRRRSITESSVSVDRQAKERIDGYDRKHAARVRTNQLRSRLLSSWSSKFPPLQRYANFRFPVQIVQFSS